MKNERGITLVALIVTVIIMAIIAGAGISLIFRNEGIIESAKAVVNEYVLSGEDEQEQLGILENKLTEFTSNSNNNARSLQIGDTVNYSVTLNDVVLNSSTGYGWKVFYIDGDYTYIILSDYLPRSAVSSTVKTSYNLGDGDESVDRYRLWETSWDRLDLINALAVKSNWNELLSGTINGNAINQTPSVNVYAMGAPTLELWVNSWNTKYPSDMLYTKYENPVTGEDYDGWYIGDSENPTSTHIDLSSKEGYNDELYFPGDPDSHDLSRGYWLCSPAAGEPAFIMHVLGGGKVVGDDYYQYDEWQSARPIIRLPSSILN